MEQHYSWLFAGYRRRPPSKVVPTKLSHASSNNSFYNDVGLRYGPSFGARYDANDYIALKAQLDHTVRRGEPDLNGLHLQLAFAF